MKQPKTVADLKGGEIARVEILVRVTHRACGPERAEERWAIPLTDLMFESLDHLWLSPSARVVEVLPAKTYPMQRDPDETDPLKLGGK